MDPQSSAHLIRILRTIAIELRIANDIAHERGYPYAVPQTENDLDLKRDRYREQAT